MQRAGLLGKDDQRMTRKSVDCHGYLAQSPVEASLPLTLSLAIKPPWPGRPGTTCAVLYYYALRSCRRDLRRAVVR